MNPNMMTEDPVDGQDVVSYPQIPVESEATGEGITGTLVSETITVPPVGTWRTRALHALRQGDFDSWAEAVLSEQDYQTWLQVDPTVDEVNSFFAAIRSPLGLDRGKSGRSSRSSSNTVRR